MDVIRASGIPLRLKNVMNVEGKGTIIYPSTESPDQSPSPTPPQRSSGSGTDLSLMASTEEIPRSVFMTKHGYFGDAQKRRIPTALTVKDSVTIITLKPVQNTRPHLFLGQVSETLQSHSLSIDLISSSLNSVSLAVSTTGPSQEVSVQEALADLESIGIAKVTRNMCIISVVGHKMRNMVGVACMSETSTLGR